MPELDPPQREGVWTRLQVMPDRAMWQQDRPLGAKVISRFWIVNPPETLVYDTFDEAEAMFEALSND
jgi:hypothetical protein